MRARMMKTDPSRSLSSGGICVEVKILLAFRSSASWRSSCSLLMSPPYQFSLNAPKNFLTARRQAPTPKTNPTISPRKNITPLCPEPVRDVHVRDQHVEHHVVAAGAPPVLRPLPPDFHAVLEDHRLPQIGRASCR